GPRPGGKRGGAACRGGGVAPLLCCFAGTGVVFGSLEVTTVSGTGDAAGVLLGVQAAGSGLAGLALGAYGRPLRLGRCLALMAALLLLPPLCAATTDAAWPLAPALLLIGTATAPVMITAMNTLHVRVPAHRLTEAMSWAVTAILAGSSAGATAAGHLADGPHPWLGYAIPPMAAAGAWLAVRAGSRERQARPAPSAAHPHGRPVRRRTGQLTSGSSPPARRPPSPRHEPARRPHVPRVAGLAVAAGGQGEAGSRLPCRCHAAARAA
ncbi:hypothetical protein GA0115246_1062611, partial [Streptomyces sp. SolWspMP-sol7th]